MLEKRKYLYGRATVEGNKELDYLVTDIPYMDITTSNTYTIQPSTRFRPDLISKVNYDSYDFGWLIMDYNDIIDPFVELEQGKELLIPEIESYLEFFNTASKVSKERNNQ